MSFSNKSKKSPGLVVENGRLTFGQFSLRDNTQLSLNKSIRPGGNYMSSLIKLFFELVKKRFNQIFWNSYL